MDAIIAGLLALTMAIFPISMPRAAASNGPEHSFTLDTHHTHDDVLASCDQAFAIVCGDHGSGNHDSSGSNCCGVGVCHAFEVSAAPDVHWPYATAAPMAIAGDEQVEGVNSGRLDRPPRTV
jgi:hypothetical protein